MDPYIGEIDEDDEEPDEDQHCVKRARTEQLPGLEHNDGSDFSGEFGQLAMFGESEKRSVLPLAKLAKKQPPQPAQDDVEDQSHNDAKQAQGFVASDELEPAVLISQSPGGMPGATPQNNPQDVVPPLIGMPSCASLRRPMAGMSVSKPSTPQPQRPHRQPIQRSQTDILQDAIRAMAAQTCHMVQVQATQQLEYLAGLPECTFPGGAVEEMLGKRIGGGQTSVVYARYSQDGEHVVRKVASDSKGLAGEKRKLEQVAMRVGKHERILLPRTSYQMWVNGKQLDVLEFAHHDSLEAFLTKTRQDGLHVRQITRFVQEIIEGLAVLHGHNIVHGDVALRNLMLDANTHVVIIDFGRAWFLDESYNQLTFADNDLGFPNEAAPEVELGRPRRESDIYSFAVVIYEILSGERWSRAVWLKDRQSFSQECQRAAAAAVAKVRDLLPSCIPPNDFAMSSKLVDLMERCLDLDPTRRPTASDLLQEIKQIRSEHSPSFACAAFASASAVTPFSLTPDHL